MDWPSGVFGDDVDDWYEGIVRDEADFGEFVELAGHEWAEYGDELLNDDED
jgi:hypothetical protein